MVDFGTSFLIFGIPSISLKYQIELKTEFALSCGDFQCIDLY